MKVIAKRDAFWKKALVREGQMLEINCDDKTIPVWAEKIVEKKAQKKPEAPKQDDGKTEEQNEKLERLKDIAIDNNIFVEFSLDDTPSDMIKKLTKELNDKGIEF